MSQSFVISNARLMDGERDVRGAVRVADGRIMEVGETLAARPGETTVDLGGAVLAPGFFDPHVHLREPGEAYKETIETGSRAAAAGGFTDVAAMANTRPALDEAYRVRGVIDRGREVGLTRVHVIAACTRDLAGEQLSEMAILREAGAIGFSDDGRPVADAGVMRRVLEWARGLDTVIVSHGENLELRGKGSMNEGPAATRLGYAGIPTAAEAVAVARDVELAALTGARLHLAHVSTARSVEILRHARARRLPVTAETAPHYLMCTDEDVIERGTAAKMNPPLRSAADRQAVLQAVAEGVIDCLATDHAPHHPDEKALPFADAPFGVVGLETALAAAIAAGLPLTRVIEAMSAAPRRIFGLPVTCLAPGQPADLVAFDPEIEWTVEPEAFHTLGRHTPFAGRRLQGRVLGTWLAGRRVFERAATEAADGRSRGHILEQPLPTEVTR